MTGDNSFFHPLIIVPGATVTVCTCASRRILPDATEGKVGCDGLW